MITDRKRPVKEDTMPSGKSVQNSWHKEREGENKVTGLRGVSPRKEGWKFFS